MTTRFTNPLHLYRALLRETTYFFDQHARSWTHEYIRSSFHRNAAKAQHDQPSKTGSSHPTRTPSLHERHLLKRGRKFLYALQRANQGYQRSLRNLLQSAYGRKGRKRRELISPWMHYRSQDANTPTAADNGQPRRPVQFSATWLPSPEFMSLLHTQNQLSGFLSIKRTIRFDPLTQKTNRVGRPMPPCRIKKVTKNWYAKMASIILPPVSASEWSGVQAKSLGREQFNLIPRRPAARRALQEQQADHSNHAADSIVSGPRPSIGNKVRASIENPHKMTQRFLSRFYARHVLNHMPVVEPHPIAGKGVVGKWDNADRTILSAENPKSEAQAELLFG